MAEQYLGERNREHFNKVAQTAYQVPWVRDLVSQITEFLQANIEWLGIQNSLNARLLDYACGNGAVSAALMKHFAVIRGIDISDGMVQEYNASVQRRGMTSDQMHAVRGDLCAAPNVLNDPDLFDFDIIVMSMALHHVQNPEEMLIKLVERLRPGGSLIIIDGLASSESGCSVPDETSDLPGVTTINQRAGFRTQELRELFAGAGLNQFDLLLPPRSKVPAELGGEQQIFVAKGTRSYAG